MSRCAGRALQALLVCVAALGTLLGSVEVHAQRVAELEAEYQRAVETAQSGDVAQAAAQFTALLERLPVGHPLETLSIYGAARSYQQLETSAAACAAVDLFTRFLGRKDAEVEKRERASKALPALIERCNALMGTVAPSPESRGKSKRSAPEMLTLTVPRTGESSKPAEDGMVFLTIVSNEPAATLMRLPDARDTENNSQTEEAGSPTEVCSAPCELWLSRSDRFAIANTSTENRLSEAFSLPDRELATLHIESKSKSTKSFGRGLAVLGVVSAMVGVGTIASSDGNVGIGLVVAGSVVSGLGVVLDLSNTAEITFSP